MSSLSKPNLPISFSLLNDDGQPILDILDSSEGQNLKLEITNISGRDLKLLDLGSNEATLEKHHFKLEFKPGILNTKSQITLGEADSDWRISQPPDVQGTNLYLLCGKKDGLTLAADASTLLTLQHVSAAGRSGAQGTDVMLNYKNLQYVPRAGSPTPNPLLAGDCERHLNLAYKPGKKDIPLHVGIVGPNTILNDGKTKNELTLKITNLLKDKSLSFIKTQNATTTFVLSFDVYDSQQRSEWALGDGASVQGIGVRAVKIRNGQEVENWSALPETQGQTPRWLITPPSNTELAPGESIHLKLSKIVSSMFSGPANLYLRYEHIPDYWDGQFIISLEKSYLIQRDQLKTDGSYDQKSYIGIGTDDPKSKLHVVGDALVDGKVGIGTTDPKSQLDVNGVANIWSGEHYAASNGQMKPGSLTIGSTSASYGGSTRTWADNNVAGLLLETLNNTEIAVHNHNRRLASLMYYEGGDVNRITIGRNMGNDSLSTLALNGRVGVGTTAPQCTLDIRADGSSYGMLRLRNSGATAGEASIGFFDANDQAANDAWVAGVGGWSKTGDFTIGNNGGAGEAVKLLIKKSGNVGIGTTDPKSKLHVAGETRFDGDVGIGTKNAPLGHLEISNGWRDWIFLKQERSTAGGGGFHIHNPWGDGQGDERNRLEIAYQTAGGVDNWSQFVINGPTGNIGIGTGTPGKGKLEINGTASGDKPGFSYKKWFSMDGIHEGGSTNQALSIYASGDIAGGAVFVFSDERMKNIQRRSDGAADLQTLLGIEVTNFRYKDVIGKGDAPHKKAIAQQVEKVFPQAVSQQTDVVPDIYQRASFTDGWVNLATDLKQGERVRLISEKGEGVYEVLEVAENKFRTDFKPEGDKVFVYGREVNDFRSLDYDAIAMLNVSATQQLKKEKDEEVRELRAEVAELKAANEALQKRLQLLESKFETAPTVVSAKNDSNGNGKR
jgi:hypothetical protein